jgi:5-methylcytosine-specific restriction protein A
MPEAPRRPCSIPGCPNFQTRNGRCEDHQFTAWKGSERNRSLPADWPERRLRVLRRDGYRCQECGAPATEVDHVGSPYDHSMSNLRALCSDCHRKRTAAQGVAARLRRKPSWS